MSDELAKDYNNAQRERSIANSKLREMEKSVGNAAKQREAIAKCVNLITEFGNAEIVKTPLDVIVDIEVILKAALAEPPRQCDVGTAEEQAQRFGNHCESLLTKDGSKPCTGCPCCGVVQYGRCEFAWMQMPYNESEAVQ